MRRTRAENISAKQLLRAETLIRLGARSHIIIAETDLARKRILRMCKQITGISASRGLLPSKPEWHLTFMANIHSSLFMNLYRDLNRTLDVDQIDVAIRTYEMYLDAVRTHNVEVVLSFTRAWSLIKLFDINAMKMAACTECGDYFVIHAYDLAKDYVCQLCRPHNRSAKGKL